MHYALLRVLLSSKEVFLYIFDASTLIEVYLRIGVTRRGALLLLFLRLGCRFELRRLALRALLRLPLLLALLLRLRALAPRLVQLRRVGVAGHGVLAGGSEREAPQEGSRSSLGSRHFW